MTAEEQERGTERGLAFGSIIASLPRDELGVKGDEEKKLQDPGCRSSSLTSSCWRSLAHPRAELQMNDFIAAGNSQISWLMASDLRDETSLDFARMTSVLCGSW